jgi:hypothetical protein
MPFPRHFVSLPEWKPPLWLSGDKGTKTKVPLFSVPVSSVPSPIRKAIRKKLKPSFHQEKKQITTLTAKLSDQTSRLQDIQERVQELEELKERGLKDIRHLGQDQATQSILDMETELLQQHEKQRRKEEQQWKEELTIEFERKRKERRKDLIEEAIKKRQKTVPAVEPSVITTARYQALKRKTEETKKEAEECKHELEILQGTTD